MTKSAVQCLGFILAATLSPAGAWKNYTSVKKEIKILELNGAGAEPGHIYDPKFPFLQAYKVLFQHWNILYQISKANYEKGISYMSAREAWQMVSKLRSNRKLMKEA